MVADLPGGPLVFNALPVDQTSPQTIIGDEWRKAGPAGDVANVIPGARWLLLAMGPSAGRTGQILTRAIEVMAAGENSLFPRGWFVIAWSSELPVGGLQTLRDFERDRVLFRAEIGFAHVLDAQCPHLGAHLGHGGQMEGATVACPFHAWRFDGAGRCAQIPLAERIPPWSTLRAWTVVARNGPHFLWHDDDGGGPTWEVPTIEAFGSEGRTPWQENRITVATHPREIVENASDKGHYPTVHSTHVDTLENHHEGHCATQHTVGRAHPIHGGVDHFDIVAPYRGQAFQLSDMRGVLHSRLLLAHTPIDRGNLHLRFAVSLARKGPRTDQFAQMDVDNLLKGFHQDIAIWDHKVFREAPRLAATDGPLGRLRQWYRQFYRPAGEPEGAAAE